MKIQCCLIGIVVLLAACSQTPDYKRPSTETYLGERFVQTENGVLSDASTSIQWWKRFNDDVINEFVGRALENNLDIKVASANVLEFEALSKSALGSRWPEVGAQTSGERSFTGSSTGSSFNAGSDRLYTTTYLVGASITWQADLFGRLRSAERAAIADWQVSQTDREAVLHTVIANVISQRVQLAISLKRLEVAQNILKSRENTLSIVNRRYQRGVAGSSAVDVRLARENVFSAQADILRQEQDVALAQHQLDILLGQKPSDIIASNKQLSALSDLEEAIVGVPASLLDRRPDLRAAEFRVIANNERVGVAIADLLPDLRIVASSGWRDAEVSELFSSTSLFGSILGELTQTLFSGGRLRAETDAAKARLEEQAFSYANEVLQAIREVEDELVKNHKLNNRLKKIRLQLNEARLAEDLSRSRYARGVENLLTVLETERRRQIAEDSLLQVQLDYWNARINLYLALGGDWLTKDEVKAAWKTTK